ncbi:MAG: DUF1847 domain-containing protein [Candidatus Bathyarchaeia archaeon]
MKEGYVFQCDKCPGVFCQEGRFERDRLPDFCPMKTAGEVMQEALKEYASDDVKPLYVSAAITEKESYEVVGGKIIPVRPRIRELVEFAKKIGLKKIGVAFCGGLSDEASRVADVLRHFNFKVYSVRCKCGGLDKSKLEVPEEYKISMAGGFEAACNPIAQALLLNSVKTDLNVIVGLCVGHDILFTKYSKAPITTLIVKDRYTGHNPLIALYSRYHRAFLM